MSTVKSKSSITDLLCHWCGKNKKLPGASRCRSCQDKVNARQKELRATNRAAGLCTCGRQPPKPGTQTCQTCEDEQLKSHKASSSKNRRLGLCHCGNTPEINRKHCTRCLANYRRKTAKLRRTVLEHYGLKCACCPETIYEFLEIDHIDGGGNDHRRVIGYTAIYRWLIKHNFPPGFQTLCSSCNRAKFRYGMCPHERERRRQQASCEENHDES